MSSNQSQSRSVVSATSQAQGDSLLDPIYISGSEDEAAPEVTYISSDSEDEDDHLSQDAVATDNEVVSNKVFCENLTQCHSCPICLEIAFQPYILFVKLDISSFFHIIRVVGGHGVDKMEVEGAPKESSISRES
ncbi:hypothetical protein F5877DRAFT_71137 [Lentinula edodes]|nr:hypothetical protein F5877DRAFT_71137 [Lentinula edodes]